MYTVAVTPMRGVAEEFLDRDGFDALFQKQGRGRVSKVAEPDAAKAGLAKRRT
ncbi:hypothetical protein [Streptomyces sp. NPDC058371]|uniref:hypothetical protein n=1 Tax=Streptomyces sp. NPDC058371 TaxID=3346463 RepID=UPI0036619ED5